MAFVAEGRRLGKATKLSTLEAFKMDLPVLANILGGSFTHFRGHPEELYRCLLSRRDFTSLAGCPSDARGFLLKLKEIAPALRALGVDVQVLATGQIRIRSREAAEAEEAETARLRAAFFGSSAEAAAIRGEFGGNSQDAFQRWMAYKRGAVAGRIHEPRGGGRVAEEHAIHSHNVASRLPIEDQCRQTWNSEPSVRSEFRNNFASFLAFEKAAAAGQVRIRKVG
jgi:hypothetical protein